jgi:hypothetical protein
MLGIRSFTREYINDCRARVEADLAAYAHLGAHNNTFEATFFNNMAIVLDRLFVHRLRTVEGKDGKALNEARRLCESLLTNGGKLSVDTTMKYDPASSVLKLQIGDEIKLTEADFRRLADTFFAEMERKFLPEMAMN